jgi:hypothetical protein
VPTPAICEHDPVVALRPAPPGSPSLFSVAFDLGDVGYETHELFASGTARAYSLTGARTPDGRWGVTPMESADFTTRCVVHRPSDPAAANGTVVIEWLNVTGGLDVPAVWMASHRHLLRDGFTWVGVSVQKVGIDGGGVLPGLGLRESDAARYDALHHPGDEYAFDLFSEVARALRVELRDAMGLPVERMVAVGASQSAFYLTTYVNAVDPQDAVVDGFLLQGRAGLGAPIDGWDPATINPANARDTTARRARLAGAEHIRADSRVPVLVVQSETDVLGALGYLPARQPDSDHFRLWEVAGAAHCDTYFLSASPRDSGALPVDELARLVADTASPGIPTAMPINSGPQMHYVLQRAFDALDQWVRHGTAPATADRLTVDGDDLVVDDLGVARGGVRTPWVDAPAAVLSGLGQPGNLTDLFGTTRALDASVLASRYPGGKEQYVEAFGAATRSAVAAGFVLGIDAPEIERLGAAAWPG